MNSDWKKFVLKQKETDLSALIADEKLKDEETRRYMENAFRDGAVKTTGTDIDKLMPPVSRFGGGNRAAKKQGIIEKIQAFFEKYFGIVYIGLRQSSSVWTAKRSIQGCLSIPIHPISDALQ